MTNRPLLTHRRLVVIDIAAALLLAARTVTYVGGTAHSGTGPPGWLAIVLGCLAAGCVALRRWHPLWMLVIVSVAAAVQMILGGPSVGKADNELFGVALVMYTVAATRPVRPAVLALVATTVPLATLLLVELAGQPGPAPGPGVFSAAYVAAVTLTAWSIGQAVRAARAHQQGLQESAEARVTAAAQAERLKIARELHDVVAHAMTVIALHAGVGRYVIRDQPHEAERSLAAIDTTSRAALGDMRRLLGVLRDDRPGDLLPTPGLADLPELAEQVRKAGLAVELAVRGVPKDLPAGVDLAAFRVVQEALTNVIKHASAEQGRVLVRYAEEALYVEVTDDGVGGTGGCARTDRDAGHGLIGMRERVALYGGCFDAGPMPQRGFRVTARLPV